MKKKQILENQLRLNERLAELFENEKIKTFNFTSFGNSISTGYSIARTTKPLLLRNESLNDVMKQCCALPGGGGKLSEAVTISLADHTVQLMERKFEINGVKTNYLSEIYLQCHAKMSQKTKLDIVTKAVDQINKKYFEDDFEKKMEAKSVIHNTYAEQGALVPEAIGEELFGEVPEIKEEFVEKLEKYKLPKEEITLKNEKSTKKFEKQFLTTDSGIEINIPMEEYNNRQHVEFITNPDGTISVLIKNVNSITSR